MKHSNVGIPWSFLGSQVGSVLKTTRCDSGDKSGHERGKTNPHRPCHLVERLVHSDANAEYCANQDKDDGASPVESDRVHCGGEGQDLSSPDEYTEKLYPVQVMSRAPAIGVETYPVHSTKDLPTPSSSHDTSNIGDAVHLWVTSLEKSNYRVRPSGDDTGSNDQDDAWYHSYGV